MPLQNFVNFSTPAIGATWLNQVDVFVNTLFAAATTAAQARTAISAAASGANSDITSVALTGTTSAFGAALTNAKEVSNIVAAAPSSTQNVYAASGAVTYFTTNAANNWAFNFAMSTGTALNTAMNIGDTVSLAILTTQGGTAYYPTAFQIDGSAVTPKWLGGTAPSSGNASGIDIYLFSIVKTASATYTVAAQQVQYK